MPELSGPQWCTRFPTSTSPNDLLPDFRDRVLAFISVMQRGGATVTIAATYRPPERAYLMHWSWGIARGLPANMCRPGDRPNTPIDPGSVPALAGVDIDWSHGGNTPAARAAAEAMVETYKMQFAASLHGNHMLRRAVDMNISWVGTLTVHDFNGQERKITMPPRSGSIRYLSMSGVASACSS